MKSKYENKKGAFVEKKALSLQKKVNVSSLPFQQYVEKTLLHNIIRGLDLSQKERYLYNIMSDKVIEKFAYYLLKHKESN